MSREPALVRVKVSDGTQIAYDGDLHAAGSEVSVPEAIAERWIVRGWAEPLEPASKPSPRSRRTR